VSWVADTQMAEQSKHILQDVLDTPVSPELLPVASDGQIAQITEDTVGPYLLHDFFLYNMMRFSFTPEKIYFLAKQAFTGEFADETILKWLKVFYRRFFSQQFKRSCIPDGPKVGSINLSPRGDWRMPSDASAALWLKELEEIKE
jgi:NAD+ synthase (glutamine-hydrolysing)